MRFAEKMVTIKFFIIFISTLLVPYVENAKILAVFTMPSKSHFMMTKEFVKELTVRGHEVTFITSFPINEKLNNFTQIEIIPVYDFWTDVKDVFDATNLFDLTSMSVGDFMKMLDVIGVQTTEHALKQPNVQKIINGGGSYDLLLVEQFYQEAFLALGHIYDVPVVSMSTLGYENYMSQMMGLITPWSYVPHGFLPFDDRMTFVERLQNTLYSLYEDWHREYVYFPKQDYLVRKYFSHFPIKFPSVSEMEKNLSAIFLNSHIPLTTARPAVMGLIPVGGMHIKPPRPLPNDIKSFLDGAVNGVIYFSLGSNVRSSDMPTEKREMFLNVFRNMKQKVLWKFEDENIKGLPENVMVKAWMPQADILAHPNVKVFITHGGLFGTQEGVYNAVPMLGMPIYCDQHLNMNKASKSGYAISFKFQEITAENFKSALEKLLSDPSYKTNVEKISKIFRDRPMSAMDTAMYWVDYIIRHNGAPQLRAAGLDLAWYQFYLLDVIAVPVFGLIIVIYALNVIRRKLCNLFNNGNGKLKRN